jgi:hypothetical protein
MSETARISETPIVLSAASTGETPTVFLLPFLLGDKSAVSIPVPPSAVDSAHEFLKQVTGYAVLESRECVFSPIPSGALDASTLKAVVYFNKEGQHENEPNLGASRILGIDLYGKVVVVCYEEGKGDKDGEGQYSSVISLRTLFRKLFQRNQHFPYHTQKIVSGLLGDMLHEMKCMMRDWW